MGERLVGSTLWTWAQRLGDKRPTSLPKFTSPLAAQYWFEWEPKWYRIPGATAIFTLLFFGIAVCSELTLHASDAAFWLKGFLIASVAVPPYAAFASGAMFAAGMERRKPGIRTFTAVCPLSNSQLAKVYLKAGALNALAAWGIVLLAAAAWYILFCGALHSPGMAYYAVIDLLRPFGPSPFLSAVGIVFAVLAASWAILGLASSLVSAGRAWLVMTVGFVPVAGAFALPLMARHGVFPEETLASIAASSPWLVSAILIAGTALAFWTAHNKGIIDARSVGMAFTVWLSVAGAAELCCISGGLKAPAIAVFVFGASALLLAPFATLPLALAWNRHR